MLFMRNLLFIPAFTMLLCILLPGCNRQSSAERQAMAHAERLMDSLPDSALAVMQSITLPSDANEADRARHALLLSQALDKNYIDVTDDSLISVADTYYRTSSDQRHRMLASFYHGRVHYNAQDYPRALYQFTEALDLATAIDDPFWKARAANEIAAVYNITRHYGEALQFSQKALEYNILSSRQPHLNYSYLNYAISCLSTADSANSVIAEKTAYALLDSAAAYHDAALEQSVHSLLVNLYYWQNDWEKVIFHGKKALQHTTCNNDVSGRIGMAYLSLNQPEEASKLLPDTINFTNAPQLALAYTIKRNNGDLKGAITLLERLRNLEDSVLSASLYQNLTNSISSYYVYKSNLHAIELQQTRNTRLYLAIIAAIIIIMVIFIAVKSNRAKKSELQKSLLIAENLRNILSTKDTELINTHTHIKELFANRFTEIDNLCRRYYEFKSDRNLKKQIAKTVEHVIAEFSVESPKIKELQSFLDQNCDNVYTSFVHDYPDLPANDYLLFLYNGLGFSTSAMTLFFNVDTTSVYNRKRRLKARIKSTMPPRAADYLQILK